MSERIGPYVIDSRIGMGGMGIVYAAHDEALNRRVALKVISPQLADDAEFRARFVREARAMASLESPHVVSVFAHGETDGQLWMATQFFPDGDLGTVLRRSGPPPLPEAVELMAQVADGLAAAHAVGLVHRDIKPANVLLRRSGMRWTAALADFGIARAGADQTGLTQGGMVGTPSFMAPELHTGGESSPASDIYSMGCLLWTSVAGTAPYPGTTDYEVVSAHLEQPVPQLEGDTPYITGTNAVLRRAMAKDPAQRHRDASELRDELRDLARVSAQGPTVVRRAGPPPATPASSSPDVPSEPTASGTSDNTRTLILIAVAVIALFAVLGVAFTRLLGPDEVARTTTLEASAPPASVTEDPTRDPTEDPSDDPTGDPTVPTEPTSDPTDGATTTPEPGPDGFTDDDRAAATESFVEALQTQPTVTPDSAQCVAEEILTGDGLAQMVEARFFDADWAYVDHDLGPYPELQSRFTTATLACVTG